MNRFFILLMICLGSASFTQAQQLVSGYVYDAASGEALIGVSVSCKEEARGTLTNAYGYFALQTGKPCTLRFSYLGYDMLELPVGPDLTSPLTVKLTEQQQKLNEVVVNASKESAELTRNETGTIRLNMKNISSVPVLGGEKDLVKVLQLMPGIKRGSEGSSAMLVRGGSADQNLVLIDEAPVYNPSHLLGIFSVFNSDAVRDVTMQKGGFTANYGGRLSSVLDVKTREGNMKELHVGGGVGLLSARASVEGPILKDRLSFIVSGRRTYIDQAFRLAGGSLPFYFYDLNAKINYRISDRDKVYLSLFTGRDVLSLTENSSIAKSTQYNLDFGTTITNQTATLRWNHVYAGGKLFHNLSVIGTGFGYVLQNRIDTNSMRISSSINDVILKLDYDYYKSNRSSVKFGGEYTQHHFRPNVSDVRGNFNESIRSGNGLDLYTNEFALYVLNDLHLGQRWGLNYGMRFSGAETSGKVYLNAEPRATVAYRLRANQSIKLAYSEMNQYLHLVTSSSSSMPTDLWYPVSPNIKPQTSRQLTAAYVRELSKQQLVFTAEAYYKWLSNVVEFREGTVGLLNNNIEADLVQGTGKSYGLELLLQKQGRLNGWVGYTLSWTTRHFDALNKGETFYMRYDRRHDISVVANYELTPRITLSGAWVFATGSRFTPVIGQYLMPNGSYTNVDALPIYSKRNEAVLAASHRFDINVVYKSKPGKRYQWELHAGAYNVYNRTQPYRIRIVTDASGNMQYQQLGLFGFIPSVAYQFKF